MSGGSMGLLGSVSSAKKRNGMECNARSVEKAFLIQEFLDN